MLLRIITQNLFLSYHVEEKLTSETYLQRVFAIASNPIKINTRSKLKLKQFNLSKLQVNLFKLVLFQTIKTEAKLQMNSVKIIKTKAINLSRL